MLGVGRGARIITSCKLSCFRTPPTGRPRPENGSKYQRRVRRRKRRKRRRRRRK